jgi:hypothetical protein
MKAHMNVEMGAGPVFDGLSKFMVQYAPSPTTFSLYSVSALTPLNDYAFFFTVYCF